MINIGYNERIKRFFIVGSSAAFLNFLLMIMFVEVFWFKTYLLKNLAIYCQLKLAFSIILCSADYGLGRMLLKNKVKIW